MLWPRSLGLELVPPGARALTAERVDCCVSVWGVLLCRGERTSGDTFPDT